MIRSDDWQDAKGGGIPIRESDLIAHTVPPVPQVSDLPRIYGDEPAQELSPRIFTGMTQE